MKDVCNHINKKYNKCGTLTLTDPIKEQILSGASYITYMQHAGLASAFEQEINPTDTRYKLIDSMNFTVKRYIVPCGFHIEKVDEQYFDFTNFQYLESGIYYASGYLLGDFTNVALPVFDCTQEHNTFLADFIACAFINLMKECTKEAGMYLNASYMLIKMMDKTTQEDYISDFTCGSDNKLVPYRL